MEYLIESFLLIAMTAIVLASIWNVFHKAGQKGWACLIPFYNWVILNRIVGKPDWWWVLMCVPLVNVVIAIIVSHNLSRRFGFGTGMTLLLVFLPFVGFPILGFGSCQYQSLPRNL